MSFRHFIFCDRCNPGAVRVPEHRRGIGHDPREGRRISDGRMWFEGSLQEAVAAGWVISRAGEHLCPRCARMERNTTGAAPWRPSPA
ncbi:MAG: hypothetical protein AB1344_00440 [Pseudomonadota bacterium]